MILARVFIWETFCRRVPLENPVVAVEHRQGWVVPPAWEFVSKVWESERKSPESETMYDHESEVDIIR